MAQIALKRIILPNSDTNAADNTHKLSRVALASNDQADSDTYNNNKSTPALLVTTTSNEKTNNVSDEESGSLVSQQSSKHQISTSRRSILLLIFCFAQFLDSFNISELYTALPTVSAQLNMNGGESIWLISAYQLSLASCLLIGGRVGDVYQPAPVFIIGAATFSLFSIAAGFVREKIALIVFRAILGLCAALTIPSGQALIIYFYPEPKARAGALGAFGGCGSIGSVLGLVIGALLTEYASWPWTIWLMAIGAAPVALIAFLLIPPGVSSSIYSKELKGWEKIKKIDIGGMAVLISALILFIFSMTSGSTVGWKTAQTLVPLFVSLALFVAFLVWEAKLPEDSAAIPPKVWLYTNILVMNFAASIPFTLGNLIFTVYTDYWQNVFGWSPISVALHLLPFVITLIFSIVFVLVFLHRIILSKWLPISGLIIILVALILLIFADSPDRYWPLVFPSFVIACIGYALVYMHVNIGKFHVTPPSIAGTISAIVNSTAQLASAVSISIATSIMVNVDNTRTPGPNESWTDKYAGSAAVFEFYLAITAIGAISFLYFAKDLHGTERVKAEKAV